MSFTSTEFLPTLNRVAVRRAAAEWAEARRRHEEEVDTLVRARLERSSRHEKEPVEDFLFEYYALRPALLRRWHPGFGFLLEGPQAREYLAYPGYVEHPNGVMAHPSALPAKRIDFIRWLHGMLRTTAGRPGFFGCFGMHEWAMVYRTTEVRHGSVPLRLSAEAVAAAVDSLPLQCTHYDAFRFFTPAAAPRNRYQLTREQTPAFEQKGCLHANMDLYKWAFKLLPLASSDLVLACFKLAREFRKLDMRASPYDLAAYGLEPVCVETAAGRAEYEAIQRELSGRAEPLRAELISLCERLITLWNDRDHQCGTPRIEGACPAP